jgi:hypothetical protein
MKVLISSPQVIAEYFCREQTERRPRPSLERGTAWAWDLDKARFDKVEFKPGEISIRKPED